MDKIHIDLNALTLADTALLDLARDIAEITRKCSSEINNNLHGADEKVKHELELYLNHLHSLNSDVSAFAAEHHKKAQGLAVAIYDYSKTDYKPRNL